MDVIFQASTLNKDICAYVRIIKGFVDKHVLVCTFSTIILYSYY